MLWKRFRLTLLFFTFSSILLLLGKVIWFPTVNKTDDTTSFVFPEKIPLLGWKPVTINAATPPTTKLQIISQKSYRYTQNNTPVDIEMRYVKSGDVPYFIKTLTSNSTPAIVRQHQEIGFYGLGIDQQRAYLSACINPQGKSTFTNEQFNQNLSNIDSKNILSWLQGERNLKDQRCLWTHLSLNLQKSSPEAAYKRLENVWFSWYRWWQPRFPKT
ncbi:cyanoexosortase A system-associated protein [Fortiea contorta]|uniref:cyanoexosortase A system-associated protein n=1 Tax=Fortiea contorta TaxID=1892405 RepID=UPI0003462C93|nr:cyanoexosortase A system-associated protein [Fortiea contorta]